VEQMDDDRDRSPEREPEQGGVEESHLRNHHRGTENTEKKSCKGFPPAPPGGKGGETQRASSL
jgi:hypothetical protein